MSGVLLQHPASELDRLTELGAGVSVRKSSNSRPITQDPGVEHELGDDVPPAGGPRSDVIRGGFEETLRGIELR